MSTQAPNSLSSSSFPVPPTPSSVESSSSISTSTVLSTDAAAKDPISSSKNLAGYISGFVNYTPQHQYAFNKWLETTKEVYANYGFSFLHTRPFERKDALVDEAETTKQIFGVTRLNAADPDTGLAIPYDRTVPYALWVADHGNEIAFPHKRQDVGLSFRGEHAQPGRFRAFVQADVDVVGRKLGLEADVECLATLITALKALNLGMSFTFNINHLDIVKAMVSASGIPDTCQKDVFRLIDKLDKQSQEAIVDLITQIENIGVERPVIEAMVKKFAERASVESFIFDREYGVEAAKGLGDLQTMIQSLKSMNIDTSCIQFAPGMVRGLEYYTGLVFEATLDGKENYGSISAGGRYDNLVGTFNDNFADIGGVGGTIGLTRLFDIMVREKMPLPERSTVADALVGYRTGVQRQYACEIAGKLRSQGIPTDLSLVTSGVKGFYTYANRIGVPVTVCAMDSNSIVVKNMYQPDPDRTYRGEDLTTVSDAVDMTAKLLHKV